MFEAPSHLWNQNKIYSWDLPEEVAGLALGDSLAVPRPKYLHWPLLSGSPAAGGHIIGCSPQSLLQFAISVHTTAIAASSKFKESPRQLKSGARLRLGAGLPGGRPPDNIKLRSRRTLNFSPSSTSPLPSASPDTRNWQPAAEASTGSGT